MTTQVPNYYILLISKKNYRLIATDLTKQTKLKDLQQISFIGNMKKKHWSINHSSINQVLLQIKMV